jgi:hypothetical protein
MIDNTLNQVVCAFVAAFCIFMSARNAKIAGNPKADFRPGHTVLALVWLGGAVFAVAVALGLL